MKINHLDPAVLPPLRRELGASATARPGLQPRQLPAHPDLAGGGQQLVDDHLAGQADQDRREDRPARALDHIPDGRGDGLARVVSGDPRRHRDAASVAGGTMLRGRSMTGRATHRQERCVLMSAEIAGFASKWRTQRRSRDEQRDHGTAGIARRPEPRLAFTQYVRMGRVSGKCPLKRYRRLTQQKLVLLLQKTMMLKGRPMKTQTNGITFSSFALLGRTY
jgi:hypothetical protein